MERVFISYAREDIDIAKRLRRDLSNANVATWMDTFDLSPGAKWEIEISKAIKKSSFFIALLSSRSVKKRGYVQKELSYALNVAGEFPQDEVFVIPVFIDECKPSHNTLEELHSIFLYDSYFDGINKLINLFIPLKNPKTSDNKRHTGTIKFFNSSREFGFIRENGTNEEFFFFIQSFKSINTPIENMHVYFNIKEGKRGPIAGDISYA